MNPTRMLWGIEMGNCCKKIFKYLSTKENVHDEMIKLSPNQYQFHQNILKLTPLTNSSIAAVPKVQTNVSKMCKNRWHCTAKYYSELKAICSNHEPNVFPSIIYTLNQLLNPAQIIMTSAKIIESNRKSNRVHSTNLLQQCPSNINKWK